MAPATLCTSPVSGLAELLLSAALKAGCNDVTAIEEALARASFSQQSLVGAIIATGAVPENDFLRELAALLSMEWREEIGVAASTADKAAMQDGLPSWKSAA